MQVASIELAGGARSESRFFPAKAHAASLVVLPAMGVNARAYDRLGESLADAGVSALVAEHRGGDGSSVRPGRGVHFGYAELLDDAATHVRWLEAQTSGPVHLLGHSLGGQLATVGVSRWHRPGAKVVLIASGTVHYPAWTGLERYGVLLSTQLAGAVARTLGYFPGHRLGFGGLQSRDLITDWARAARTGEFTSRGATLEVGLGDAQLDVLAFAVSGDTMAPRAATERLVQKLPRARVTWEAVEPPAQPRKMNAHFRWLKSPEAVASRVAAFLR